MPPIRNAPPKNVSHTGTGVASTDAGVVDAHPHRRATVDLDVVVDDPQLRAGSSDGLQLGAIPRPGGTPVTLPWAERALPPRAGASVCTAVRPKGHIRHRANGAVSAVSRWRIR